MCVIATAQDAYMRKFNLRVSADCVAGFMCYREIAALGNAANDESEYRFAQAHHVIFPSE